MEIERLGLEGVLLIRPDLFRDERGYYMESYSKRTFARMGIDAVFVQDNHFLSVRKGTLRGVHFQNHPQAQAKLLRCTRGSILDVVVDLRRDSPCYRRWISVEMAAEEHCQIYIPKGYGHGCLSLEDDTEVLYKVDALYAPELDRAVAWNDPELQIDWGTDCPILSDKDRGAPFLRECDIHLL